MIEDGWEFKNSIECWGNGCIMILGWELREFKLGIK